MVLPSFWPRKRNMRGPGSADGAADGEAGATSTMKDAPTAAGAATATAEDADGDAFWREHEGRTTTRPFPGMERKHDKVGFEEGLRMRRREYEMPGSMPGMIPG